MVEKTHVEISKERRNELRRFKAQDGKTYDEAIAELLKLHRVAEEHIGTTGYENVSLAENMRLTFDNSELSDEEILTDLVRVAGDLDKTPSVRDYEKHGKHSTSSVKNNFGCWNNAIEAAGLETNRTGGKAGEIPESELLKDLRGVVLLLEKIPTTVEYDEYGKYSYSSVIKRFGRWEYAIAEVEIPEWIDKSRKLE